MSAQVSKLYKVLGNDRMPCHGGHGQWPPPGEWREVEGNLELCINALHLCDEDHLVMWLHDEVWEAEYDGEAICSSNKLGARKARLIRKLETWNKKTQRLFAADCAERALHIYEEKYPGDDRARKMIETARKDDNGDAREFDRSEVPSYGGNYHPATDAAYAAISACVLSAGDAAGRAANHAAYSVASAAVYKNCYRDAKCADDAYDAAHQAERAWQTKRLMEYLYPTEGQTA